MSTGTEPSPRPEKRLCCGVRCLGADGNILARLAELRGGDDGLHPYLGSIRNTICPTTSW